MPMQSLTTALIALAPVASWGVVPAESFFEESSDLNLALLGLKPYTHHDFYHIQKCGHDPYKRNAPGFAGATNCWNKSLEFQFLHVGKCAGTSLEREFEFTINLSRAEMLSHKASSQMTALCGQRMTAHQKYVFFVRAPISRYISGWISRFRYGSPRHPEQEPWSQAERIAYSTFKSPDELGCALNSSNSNIRIAAETAIRSIQHTHYDLSFYLHDVELLRRCMDQVFFVGRTEHFHDDVEELVGKLRSEHAMLDVPFQHVTAHKTTARYDHFKELGSCAIQNLRDWYRRDYEIIDELASAGKLPSSYPAEVREVDGWSELSP